MSDDERGVRSRPPRIPKRCRKFILTKPTSFESFKDKVTRKMSSCVVTDSVKDSRGVSLERHKLLVNNNESLINVWGDIQNLKDDDKVIVNVNYIRESSERGHFVSRVDFKLINIKKSSASTAQNKKLPSNIKKSSASTAQNKKLPSDLSENPIGDFNTNVIDPKLLHALQVLNLLNTFSNVTGVAVTSFAATGTFAVAIEVSFVLTAPAAATVASFFLLVNAWKKGDVLGSLNVAITIYGKLMSKLVITSDEKLTYIIKNKKEIKIPKYIPRKTSSMLEKSGEKGRKLAYDIIDARLSKYKTNEERAFYLYALWKNLNLKSARDFQKKLAEELIKNNKHLKDDYRESYILFM